MSPITLEAVAGVLALKEAAAPDVRLAAGDIRKLSAGLYRKIGDKHIDSVFTLCEELLSRRDWALGVIAFDWAYRVRKQYDERTYGVFFGWLKNYVRGWGDCDDFCTHAFGELLRGRKALFPLVLTWTQDVDFWVRRASAVVLIPSIRRGELDGLEPLRVADALLRDEHELVQKGYGWMLKCYSEIEPETVKQYLIDRRAAMPRTAFRYALEKFDPATRAQLMAL